MDITNWTNNYLDNLKDLLDQIDRQSVSQAADLLWQTYSSGKRVYVVGNGGSASTAAHIACDFSKTIKGHKGDASWPGFKIISLTDNNSLITAWSNDVSYADAYAGELENLIEEGDLLIAISSSGNSENILNCVRVAKKSSAATISISGFGGGELAKMADVALVTDSKDYGPVEDIQLILNHILVFYFFEKLNNKP